jgi:hypothetical protein
MIRRSGLKPFCLCGCGRRVKGWENKYFTVACVPLARRSAGGTKARRAYAYRRRAILFGTVFDRLTQEGRRFTKEALLDAFAAIYDLGYKRGYHACDDKMLGRPWGKRPAA